MINIGTYSYLISPFFIKEGAGIERFKSYINNLSSDDDADFSELSWKQGRVIRYNSKRLLFREGVFYPHFMKRFASFADNHGGASEVLNDVHVLSLQKKDLERYYDEHLVFNPDPDSTDIKIDFTIHNFANSFDAVKLVVNLNSQVGLLIIPIPTKLPLDNFAEFIYFIRKTSSKAVKIADSDEKLWSINDFLDNIMGDFRGCYDFITDEAHHLSYLLLENDVIDDDTRSCILSISEKMKGGNIDSLEKCLIKEIPNQLLISSSAEGTIILSRIDEKIKNSEQFAEYYKIEQTERYIIYMTLIMQRYSLLKLVKKLTEISYNIKHDTPKCYKTPKQKTIDFLKKAISLKGYFQFIKHAVLHIFHWWHGRTQSNKKRIIDELREQVKILSLIRIENYFSIISEYSLYNEFYQMCSASLGIDKLYTEIEQKMSMLNTYLTQQTEEVHERAELQLSIILAILTVTSTTSDIIALSSEHVKQPWLFIIALIFMITFVTYLYSTIFKSMRK